MGFLKVDATLCKRDGICVAECPVRLLTMPNDGGTPEAVPDAATRCVQCGHCVAVCPHGALALDTLSPADCPPANSELAPGRDTIEYLFHARRSIRVFQSRQPESEKVVELLDMARYAPTAGNSRQIKWLVINSREKVAQFTKGVIDFMCQAVQSGNVPAQRYNWVAMAEAFQAGVDRVTRDAPTLVFAYAPEAYRWAAVDGAIALTHLDLAAPALGLGTCWAGLVMAALSLEPGLAKNAGLPEGHVCSGMMMVGYPKFAYHRLPERKSLDLTFR